MLDFFAARATPGIEIVEGETYRRSVSWNGSNGYFEVSLDDTDVGLKVRLQFGDPRALFFIVERIRAMFDLNADWAEIAGDLRTDALLSQRLDQNPGLRVPGCWNGFELAIRAILGQQITVKGATALAGRLASSFGTPYPSAVGLTHIFPAPSVLAEAQMGRIGVTTARAQTIRALARAVCDGKINFEGIVDS